MNLSPRSICLPLAIFALAPFALAGDATVTVSDPTPGATAVSVTLDDYTSSVVSIAGVPHQRFTIASEGRLFSKGAPDLPRVARSLIIPDDAAVAAAVIATRFVDIPNVDIAPDRGPISRQVDPASVPYRRGPAYGADAFFPAEIVSLREPHILRDLRGITAEINLFQYNPVTRTLRIHNQVDFEVVTVGKSAINVYDRALAPDRRDRSFQAIQRSHFINFDDGTRAPTLNQSGDLLIISRGSWMDEMQPLVDWKNSQGVNTNVVNISSVGNSSSAIDGYISSEYSSRNLAYVLLVGDSNHVTSLTHMGGKADPMFGTIDSDWYPDVIVGRFSAASAADVTTQVNRSIAYEQQNHALDGQDANRRGIGIASIEGPGHNGEYDDEHMDLIRDDLLAYGFTNVSRRYDPNSTRAQITSDINGGRRMINYCGHGSDTSWSTTGFSNSDVNNLSNTEYWPIINSVACVNGNFSNGTCFAEAWLRATSGGQPSGAVAAHMATINQYWSEPMYGEDASVDLFVAEEYMTVGAMWYAGSCQMMDDCGVSGQDMFRTWHIFGDPSLVILDGGGSDCVDPVNYCTTAPNSTGSRAGMGNFGGVSVSTNDFRLYAYNCPPSQLGIFFYGPDPTAVPLGNGQLCVGGNIDRFAPNQISIWGDVDRQLDFTRPPSSAGQILDGSTWRFQFWFRDSAAGGANTNLTDGLEATFCQ
ncbi:MAG TPA: C25 family cysteine peptidase [Planctomycetota bacterium]|nr:C25 family cysteine peptidase [Planctomycetota bacterium]